MMYGITKEGLIAMIGSLFSLHRLCGCTCNVITVLENPSWKIITRFLSNNSYWPFHDSNTHHVLMRVTKWIVIQVYKIGFLLTIYLVHDHLQCEPCMLAFKYNMQAYLHYNNRWDSVMHNSRIIVEPKTSKQHYALDFLVSSKETYNV